jgi:hypothetical protein
MKRMKILVASAVVLSFLASGCIGSFVAFNKLRTWNQTATNEKWVNEVIFLGLHFIPVYGIAAFADIIIFNSIEFWTGENPMEKATFSMDGDKKVVQKFSRDDNGRHMQVLYYEKEELKHTLSLHQMTGSSTLTGQLAWTDGRTEEFLVQAQDQGVQVIHQNDRGQITSSLYDGDALEQVRYKIARISGEMRLSNLIQ